MISEGLPSCEEILKVGAQAVTHVHVEDVRVFTDKLLRPPRFDDQEPARRIQLDQIQRGQQILVVFSNSTEPEYYAVGTHHHACIRGDGNEIYSNTLLSERYAL